MNSSPGLIIEVIGRADDSTAFAMVNRHWLDHLSKADDIRIRSVQRQEDLSGEADYVIWHNWEEDFAALQPPESGKFIAVRTWDFGPFPPAWARKITSECDRLWVHTDWIRQNAIAGGVPENRIGVIPHGVDAEIFCPTGPAWSLPEEKLFYFLFVGASIRRKGFDLVLRAFLSEFSPEEGACLIVKDRSSDLFYEGLDHGEEIEAHQAHLASGSLVHIREDLSTADLASLYRSCDLSVYPYRAEGFGMTILESMACGTPCIVPRFGACLDFCNDDNAIFVQPKRINVPVRKSMVYNTLGFTAEVEEIDFCEVPVERLAKAMREAFDAGRAPLAPLSHAAAGVHQSFQWQHTAARIIAELEGFRGQTPVRFAG